MKNNPPQLIISRDICNTPQYFKLREVINGSEIKATYLVFLHWTWLAYIAETTGIAGMMPEADARLFDLQVSGPLELGERSATQMLVESSFFRQVDGGFFSPRFAAQNFALDSRYIPKNQRARLKASFRRMENAAAGVMPKIEAKIPTESWSRPDGSKVSREIMERAVRLIYMADGICQFPVRQPKNYSAGIIVDAVRQVESHEWKHLVALMLKIYGSRFNSDNLIPRSPDMLIKNIDLISETLNPIQ